MKSQLLKTISDKILVRNLKLHNRRQIKRLPPGKPFFKLNKVYRSGYSDRSHNLGLFSEEYL